MADAERRVLSGTEALVELPLIQRRLDATAGLDTAGFVTGYRGSPLGGYDQALVAAKDRLDAANVRFQPGLNEDLAATAIWGTQQVGLWPGATVDGVFGIWYGKGPGVDRSIDALKHGNAAGTSARGGVLLIAGDDHGCVSSTLPHQSGPVFAAASIPVLTPSNVSELIEYGLLGIAMSRASGCWVAMTGASEVIETTATVDLEPAPPIAVPTADAHIRWPDPPMEQERRLHQVKLPAALAFAEANRIDRIAVDHADPALTIVTTGKAYGDVRAALALLGDVPVRVVKVGLAWPLGPWVGDWIADDPAVLVVEEKRAFVEEQLVGQLINRDARPIVTGKRDEDGAALLPSIGELSAGLVAEAIAGRIERLTGTRPPLPAHAVLTAPDASLPARAPFFCAGCPHNTSTVLPEGSRAMGGIGCHGMATWMPDRNTAFLTHMGAEGATWIGQASFTRERHVFQNMGDGTYNHSGLLAIRAAIAAGVNITYKILYNDAVAMTGGQPHDGAVTVESIAAQVAAEGARAVAVVSEQPERFAPRAFGAGVTLDGRDALDDVQKRLRDTPGVTVLIYDQTCAAELRRRRRTDESLRRTTHVLINPEVCEGCGDCSAVSNCIAIQPLETPLGRKRRVDPASCNQDYSCIEGFCPSFVTVEMRGERPAAASAPETPPVVAPPSEIATAAEIVIAGIGGTGVVTIGAILAAAAEIDGLACSVLDVTGLSQKNGAVMSQVRLGQGELHGARVAEGAASLLIACDLIAATAPPSLSRCGPRTRVIANSDVAPTAAFIREGGVDLGRAAALERIAERCDDAPALVDATELAERLVGGAMASNILLLGHAWQSGAIPLSLAAMMRAIDTAARGERNRAAFDWGRALAAGAAIGGANRAAPDDSDALVEDRAARLTAYQNAAYADRYRARIAKVAQAEAERIGGDRLTRAAAIALYRLMAVKDEYEVARLHLDPAFAEGIALRFGPDARISYHLAAPLLGGRKRRFGSWMRPVFRILGPMRRLRGGALDPFGWTAERREERVLLAELEGWLDGLPDWLSRETFDDALARIEATALVRGYGHVKARSISAYRARLAQLADAPAKISA